MAASVDIHVGAEFSTLKECLEAMKQFEIKSKTTYWRRDTRTLENARKRGINVPDNPEIVYYSMSFACNSGGRNFKSKGSGKRHHEFRGSYRNGCESMVNVRATKDASKLVVMKILSEHNHELSEETFQYLPKCRKLNPEQAAEVDTIIKTKPNKKILQHHIKQVYGKSITLRDLSNMSAKLTNCTEDLEGILTGLCSKENTTVEIVTDGENNLRAIYYQDKVMQEKFRSYPEVLMADATYKLNSFRMPVFIQLVVDGNGESEIVSVYVIVTEDKDTLSCLTDMFKKYNPAWTSVKTVLTDKDMTERQVFKDKMPQIELQLCLFHTLKAMRREIHCEKMGIRLEEKNHCLEIILKMAYASSEEEYSEHLERLRETKIQPVIEYVEKSWHDIRVEWVLGLKKSCHYGSNTTNRVESINQKLKQVITRFSNLKCFFRDLEIVISCFRQERDSRIAKLTLKKRFSPYPEDSPKTKYMNLLTPFAYQKVADQIDQVPKVKLPDMVDIEPVIIQSSFGECQVTVTNCTCKFVEFHQMPCRHIFALRAKKNIEIYFTDLVDERWKMENYTRKPISPVVSNSEIYEDSSADIINEIPISILSKPAIKTQAQRYKAAFHVAQKLATHVSEGSMNQFHQRMEIIEKLLKLWDDGALASVSCLENSGEETSDDRSNTASSSSGHGAQRSIPVTVKCVNRPELLSTVPPPVAMLIGHPVKTSVEVNRTVTQSPAVNLSPPVIAINSLTAFVPDTARLVLDPPSTIASVPVTARSVAPTTLVFGGGRV